MIKIIKVQLIFHWTKLTLNTGLTQLILSNHETIESVDDSSLLTTIKGDIEELGWFGKKVNEMIEVAGA